MEYFSHYWEPTDYKLSSVIILVVWIVCWRSCEILKTYFLKFLNYSQLSVCSFLVPNFLKHKNIELTEIIKHKLKSEVLLLIWFCTKSLKANSCLQKHVEGKNFYLILFGISFWTILFLKISTISLIKFFYFFL